MTNERFVIRGIHNIVSVARERTCSRRIPWSTREASTAKERVSWRTLLAAGLARYAACCRPLGTYNVVVIVCSRYWVIGVWFEELGTTNLTCAIPVPHEHTTTQHLFIFCITTATIPSILPCNCSAQSCSLCPVKMQMQMQMQDARVTSLDVVGRRGFSQSVAPPRPSNQAPRRTPSSQLRHQDPAPFMHRRIHVFQKPSFFDSAQHIPVLTLFSFFALLSLSFGCSPPFVIIVRLF